MSARDRILGRLKGAIAGQPVPPAPAPSDWYAARASLENTEQLTDRFQRNIEAAHAEVHRVNSDNWTERLSQILADKGIHTLLLAAATSHGQAARDRLAGAAIDCIDYDRPVDAWKPRLFEGVDASLTAARSAIAETGTLVLWPDTDEPRLMSLVPPVHIVLLDAKRIHPTLFDAMRRENWAAGLPTNALLISGPSKTADIQQTLAYGAHGPKELIVLLVTGGVA